MSYEKAFREISSFKEICRGSSDETQGQDIWESEADKEKFNGYQIKKNGRNRNSKKF